MCVEALGSLYFIIWCTVLEYIKAEAGATEATPQQVGGHARAMICDDLTAVDGGCASIAVTVGSSRTYSPTRVPLCN